MSVFDDLSQKWDAQKVAWQRQAKRTGGSKCTDHKGRLLIKAAVIEECARELREAIALSAPGVALAGDELPDVASNEGGTSFAGASLPEVPAGWTGDTGE